ncbi:MAG TPA: ABC transporter ATP-binding protein [Rhodothermales bacterium]|nr:ABC transporter ATP-binding protein [Rhodothermales bacterium]
MQQPLLEVRHVSKVYRQGEIETPVLYDIDLDVFPGDYVALMGPSGSGKSTLLNIVSGLDVPTAGDVILDGESIVGLTESELAEWRREHIGFIFQQYHLMPVLTAFENVELPLLLLDMTKRERRERVEAALEIVGLTDRMKYYPRQLSGGQQQRVGIARAVVTDPLLIIGDEPTGNLDVRSTGDVLRLFEILNSDLGKTIVMVTHDPHAAEHAKTIEHLEKGILLENENKRDIRMDEIRAKLF